MPQTAMTSSRNFTYNAKSFLLDGRPTRLFSGEMHYFRVSREYWRDRLRKARAMGLNAICTYMPWNLHEPVPGTYDFSGMLNVAEYFRLIQEEGLLGILRPGPYICAEWDFGGLPAWLLREPDLKVRCSDPRYRDAAVRWIRRVGEELAPLTCARGGPIVMVQVENEYGAFGNDRSYLEAMRQATLEAGFTDIPLFTCDWATPHHMYAGSLEGCLTVANFGSNSEGQIGALRRLRPGQPAMCGEFWCGWFDAWGKPRNGSDDPTQAVNDLRWMLENDASFNMYMFHGGTSFGFTAGANEYETYEPDVTSYDYRAPLDESGRPTPKYHAFRELLAQFQPADITLPEVPATEEPISIARFELTESASLLDHLPEPISCPQPQPMEALSQSQGLVLYRTNIAGLGSHELRVIDAHDYAVVSLNGERVATLDRRLHQRSVKLENVPDDEALLDILIDTTGRVNFGPKIHDRKGITDRVEYGGLTLMNWQAFPLPLDAAHLNTLRFTSKDVPGPAVHRGAFEVETPGDTFLDMRGWRRGAVWVNGHALGRFWCIGPQQTLYVPGPWLMSGRNEIMVFDLESSGRRPLQGLAAPVLDECPDDPPL